MVPPELEAAVWRKSRNSPSGSNCVELAEVRQGIAVRDSKHADGDVLLFRRGQYGRFLRRIKTDARWIVPAKPKAITPGRSR